MNAVRAVTAHKTLENALREFIRRRHSDRPISISDMIKRTRFALPELTLSDDELENIIAKEIIAHRGNVAFDRRISERLSPPKD